MTREQKIHMGLRLRDIRIQRDISLAALSECCGVSAAHIGNVEHGLRSISLDALVDIVQALDVSLDYIVLGVRQAAVCGALVFRSDDELAVAYLNV